MALPFLKAGEIKEIPSTEKGMHQQPRHDAAEKAGYNTDSECRRAKRRAVDDQLRIEQDGGHHERRQPIVPHAAFVH